MPTRGTSFHSIEQRGSALDLRVAAGLIKEGPYFTEMDGDLRQKQLLFLAVAGIKPVSEIVSSHAEDKGDGSQQAVADDPKKIGLLLDQLSIAYRFFDGYPDTTLVVVGRDPADVNRFMHSKDEAERGRLLGFPETAVEAFVSDSLLPTERQEELLRDGGINILPPFALSQAHFTEELTVLRSWQRELEKYGLDKPDLVSPGAVR